MTGTSRVLMVLPSDRWQQTREMRTPCTAWHASSRARAPWTLYLQQVAGLAVHCLHPCQQQAMRSSSSGALQRRVRILSGEMVEQLFQLSACWQCMRQLSLVLSCMAQAMAHTRELHATPILIQQLASKHLILCKRCMQKAYVFSDSSSRLMITTRPKRTEL